MNKNEHYVNNKEFSQAVMDYVSECNERKKIEKEIPNITNYIGDCFLRIANRLSLKGNFRDYTYREEMVGDAIENCVKAVSNYNIEAATRTGNPNAFGYFTQICYYAFLRRIAKEKKQQEIREKYIENAGLEDVAFGEESDVAMMEKMKNRNGLNRKPKYKLIDTKKVDGLEKFM